MNFDFIDWFSLLKGRLCRIHLMEFGLVCWAGCRRRLWALAAPMGSAKESERKQTNQTEWRSHLIYGFVIEWEWMNKFNKSIDVGRLGAQRAGSGEKKTWNLLNGMKINWNVWMEPGAQPNSSTTKQNKLNLICWLFCWFVNWWRSSWVSASALRCSLK